jgi:hypothetical protein
VKPVARTDGVVTGLTLLAVGLLWVLSNLGLLDLLKTLAVWWPLVLVVWGLLELYNWAARRAS